MKRLFFALWPDDQTRKKLVAINDTLAVEGIRKLKPSNLHVTLVFLGNTEDKVAELIEKQASTISGKPFNFTFDQFEFWTKPKIFCLTASEQPQELLDLVAQLREMVSVYPFELDQRQYQSHITLARKANAPESVVFEPVAWKATNFALVLSRSTEQGVHYEVLARWPLID